MSDLSPTMSLIDLIECKLGTEVFVHSFDPGIADASVCFVSTFS